ncbi:MAG: alanine racemase [Solirubrobacterales bacterium]|nr:alanine racemase [Solirubrobacterales bacterium]
MPLRALARVNLAAIERNVARLRGALTGGAGLCAVVKADGYGHGAVPVARAALAGGARSLAVATAVEATALRAGGIEAPLLVMGAVSDEELPVAVDARAELVAWNDRFVSQLVRVLGAVDGRSARIHVKLDTGMGRLGTRDFAEAARVAERVAAAAPALELTGAMTHFASADEDPEFTATQLARFDPFVRFVRDRWPRVAVHAANSAATLRAPASHFDFVRCGIAVYGCDPMNEDPLSHDLEPALELNSYVAAVKRAAAGDSAGYGRRWVAREDTWIATVPIGYADGIRRGLTNNCEAIIGSRRFPLVGAVSMDNITIEVGSPDVVRCGDRVTIIGGGEDGSERVTAEELARRIDTINYEIVCGISSRVPRAYHRDGTPA